MDDFRVKRASEVLKRFFDDRTIEEASRFEAFRSTWKQIVGQRLADHSRPKSVLRRTLLIAADHAGWIQLLQMDQARILERISKHYPELEITSLAFSVEMVGAEEERERGVAPASGESVQAEPLTGKSASGDAAPRTTVDASQPEISEDQVAREAQTAHPAPRARSAELPQALGDIFSRMRKKDAQRAREKGN